ncbi:MAG: osmotically inducible protein OsmC [Planctomycetes bacterium]|jgi:putative redox protein|nr:osmotically inducible protein OsmC [Planctomycetota bacterium]HJM57017.1 OsmC family protein [Planctomycetota bacterium]
MVQIDVVYQGALRTQATHGPSGQTLITDAPVDNQGKGESFSPTDLVATALASCIMTLMGIAAEKRDVDLQGASARVVKGMASEGPRRIERLDVQVRVPLQLDEKVRAALERAALGCPVHATLGSNVQMDVSFEWGAQPAA